MTVSICRALAAKQLLDIFIVKNVIFLSLVRVIWRCVVLMSCSSSRNCRAVVGFFFGITVGSSDLIPYIVKDREGSRRRSVGFFALFHVLFRFCVISRPKVSCWLWHLYLFLHNKKLAIEKRLSNRPYKKSPADLWTSMRTIVVRTSNTVGIVRTVVYKLRTYVCIA